MSKQIKAKEESKYFLYPLAAVLAVIPLLTHTYEYSTHLGNYDWFSANDSYTDVFLYYKSIGITVIGAIMACVICWKLAKEKKAIKFSTIYIPLFLYAALTLLSSIFSVNRYLSFHGSYEQFESLWVLLGYVMIAYYAYLFIHTEKNVRFLLTAWFIGMAVLLLIGFSQFIGYDFFATDLGKILISDSKYWNDLSQLTINFPKGRVYGTLYNPNYVGSYAALAFPLLLLLLIFHQNKKARIGYLLLLIGTVLCLLGSQSRTGIIAIAVSMVVMLILFHKQLFRYWKPALAAFVLLAAAAVVFNHINDGVLLQRLQSMVTPAAPAIYNISDIDTKDENITITYRDNPFLIQYFFSEEDGFTLALRDEAGADIDCTYDGTSQAFIVNDTRFPGFTVTPVDFTDIGIGIRVVADGRQWDFLKKDDSYYYINFAGKTVKIHEIETADIPMGQYFSGRSRIWARTLPLLKDTIFLGTGADTFITVYPQDDYIYKTYINATNAYDVKPHNLYLQIGVQSGLVALAAFLVFYALYFVQSIRLYWRRSFDSYLSVAGAGIFLGTFAYMIAGTANDSMVTVAPIYWALTGIGLAINRMLQKSDTANKK